jgi:hypothetical protein
MPANEGATVTISPLGPAGGAATVVVPGGAYIDKDGNVAVPAGKEAEISLPGGVAMSVPAGTMILSDGMVKIGAGGAIASMAIGGRGPLAAAQGALALRLAENVVVMLDEAAPLGYSIVSSNPFIDVRDSDWFQGDIAFVGAHGLMTGTRAKPPTFSPSLPMTRAMLVAVLHRLAGSPETAGRGDFEDVRQGSWYEPAVAWAAENSVASGAGEGKFAPDKDVTREETVALLFNFAKHVGAIPGKEPALPNFADMSEVSAWALDGLRYCAATGVAESKPGNLFDPKGGATRAEIAAMLHRFALALAGNDTRL